MTAFLAMLAGAGIGAGVALAIYILGLGVELVNCACQIVTCNCDGGDAIPALWGDGSFLSVFLFCTIAGAVVGLIYGIYKMKVASDKEARKKAAADSEEAKKQRIKWASEVKQKALSVANVCDKNAKEYKPLITPTYKADAQMDLIINELANAAELKGKLDAMANDTKTKGGASK